MKKKKNGKTNHNCSKLMNSSSVTTLKIMPKISSLMSKDHKLSIAAVKLNDDFIIAKRSTIELWCRFKIAEIFESGSGSFPANTAAAPLTFMRF